MILYLFCVFCCIFMHDQTAVVFTYPVDHCQTFTLLLLSKFDKKSLDDSVFFCIFLCFLLYFSRLQYFFTHPVDHCQTFKLLLLSKFDKKSLDDSVFFCIFSVFFIVFFSMMKQQLFLLTQ